MSLGTLLPAYPTFAQAREVWQVALDLERTAVESGFNLPGEQTRANNLARLEAWGPVFDANSDEGAAFDPSNWATLRAQVHSAYGDAGATVEGVAAQERATSVLTLARDLAGGAGEFLGDAASFVGNTAGSIGGGLLSGLGVSGLVLLGAAALVGYFVLRGKP